MESQLKEFFTKEGSIGLILAIGPDGARFKEITPQVAVSHDTVSNRIDEARNIGLINTEAASNVGTTFRNTLSGAGEVCYLGMVELGLDKTHAEYVKLIKEYNSLSDDYIDRVSDREEWYDWFIKNDSNENRLLYDRFARSGCSEFPEPLWKAMKQQSVGPLLDSESEHIDIFLWEFMRYPPKPDPEDVEGVGSFIEEKYGTDERD